MIIQPNIGQGLDGTLIRMVEQIKSDLPIVPVSRMGDFKFNTDLFRLTDYILIDMCEMSWNTPFESTGSAIFGRTADKFNEYQSDDWKRFNEWVANNPPLLTFQRELLNKDVTDTIIPIDYFNWVSEIPIQSREEFEKRALSAFMFWGRSNENRLLLHADIWEGATRHGYSVCDNMMYLPDFIANEKGDKWCSLWQPHYKRVELQYILSINNIAKISIAPFGAGRKTFRHLESSVNSAMLMWEDNFAWAYPWKNGVNCIKCEIGEEVDTIVKWLKNPNLYYVYKACVENANRYRVDRYCSEYIEPMIKKATK